MRPAATTRTLAEVADELTQRGYSAEVRGAAQVAGVCLDSRRINPGELYVALPGQRHHGMDFVDQALGRGAAAVLTDPAGAAAATPQLPLLVVEPVRPAAAWAAAAVCSHPTSRLAVVGITGTQGKTTTAHILHQLWRKLGIPAGSIGTLGTLVNDQPLVTPLTTPEAPDLQGLFASMYEQGIRDCVMEVSSHSISLSRVLGTHFAASIFTNLGHDHLDFHGTMEAYFATKAELFTGSYSSLGIINVADEWGRRLAREAAIPVVTFSASDQSADYHAKVISESAAGSRFSVAMVGTGSYEFWLPLAGRFNLANALAAVAYLHHGGTPGPDLVAALAEVRGVPGRMESVGDDELAVYVDYAHKPDAVAAVLTAARRPGGRLIVVLGAGGDRDRAKREPMGALASSLADVVVITDDNPRGEDPALIRAALLTGARSGPAEILERPERQEAIATAISLAEAGDVVVIAGKGHETGQERNGVVTEFDDRIVARAELARRLGAKGVITGDQTQPR